MLEQTISSTNVEDLNTKIQLDLPAEIHWPVITLAVIERSAWSIFQSSRFMEHTEHAPKDRSPSTHKT